MDNKDALKKKVAEKLKLAREMSGLSQKQAANQLNLSRPTISEIEQGRRNVSSSELVQLSEIYDVDISWLLDENNDDSVQTKVNLAAREICKMSEEDVEKLFKLLASMKKK